MDNRTTIQRIIEIPLEEVRSPKYDQNIEHYGDHINTCYICGKPIKEVTKYVHYTTDGNIISYGGDDIANSQGLFPVGNDCAKKLVISFVF